MYDKAHKFFDLTREKVGKFTDAELEEAERVIYVQTCRIETTLEYRPGDQHDVRMSTIAALGYRKFDLALVQAEMILRRMAPVQVHPKQVLNLDKISPELLASMEASRTEKISQAAKHALAVEFMYQAKSALSVTDFEAIRDKAERAHHDKTQSTLKVGQK